MTQEPVNLSKRVKLGKLLDSRARLDFAELKWCLCADLRAGRCSYSGPSSSCWHHCWYSEQHQDTRNQHTGSKWEDRVHVHICVHSPSTWIFMATSLPSFSFARWTWPMEAAANGRSSNESSWSLQLGPRSLFNAFYKYVQDVCLFLRLKDWFMVLSAGSENLLSFVWWAWSQRSVVRDQRSWQAEGWWKRHLKAKNRWFCNKKKHNSVFQRHERVLLTECAITVCKCFGCFGEGLKATTAERTFIQLQLHLQTHCDPEMSAGDKKHGDDV